MAIRRGRAAIALKGVAVILPKICAPRLWRATVSSRLMTFIRAGGLPTVALAKVGAVAGLLALGLVAGEPVAGQGGLTTYHVQGNVWVSAGAGGNITVQASDAKAAGPGAGEGVLLVDTGRKEMTPAVLAEIEKIAPGKRIEYIVTTHVDADHVGGHETFAKPRMDYLWTPGMVTGAGVKPVRRNFAPRSSAVTLSAVTSMVWWMSRWPSCPATSSSVSPRSWAML